ncbi:hypothetical protein [Hydrogenophaga sp.]|uniref:hypothetical protein n=1 Tax=Hydrogenophaga sp. TaxID=1904254 RepID=UPI002728BB73|nr:hypothetical protein [Hydrogenophaga sp.]MDO9437981.1 hypothetical protein [Hydrogenophaga sp.]
MKESADSLRTPGASMIVHRMRAGVIDLSTRWCAIALLMLFALMISGCATGPKVVSHAFGFNTPQDSPQYEVLAYKYGDGKVVTTSSDSAIRQFGVSKQGTNVSGPMPLGDALTVKWRDKTSDKTYEDKVDLRPLLPRDMTKQRIHFVVDGAQLFVYLIDPVPRPKDWPVVGPKKFRNEKSRQIYPGKAADSKGKLAMVDTTSAPLTSAQIQILQQRAAAMARASAPVVQPGKFVFFAAFDDTGGIKEVPGSAGYPQRTSVGQMYERYDSSRPGGYYLFPDTPGALGNSTANGGAVTEQMKMTANDAYDDFVREAREWLAEDPSRSAKDISTSNMGLGRTVPIGGVRPAGSGVTHERGSQ